HIRLFLLILHETHCGNRRACNDEVRQVYSRLTRLRVEWAPAPPYPDFTEPEVRDELERIANRLEDDENRAAGRKKPANPRGRPKDREIDPKADRQLCKAWKAAKAAGATRDAFARGRGISVDDLIAAQHREKYRRVRDTE